MGLDITSIDSYGSTLKSDKYGSYHRIHILRDWALEHVEGNSEQTVKSRYPWSFDEKAPELILEKLPCLINHSDCDGGYISFSYFGIAKVEDPVDWANLDALREELKILEHYEGEMPEDVREAFRDFWEFVCPEDDTDDDVVIVKFH